MWLSSFAGIVTPNLTPSLQSKINSSTNQVSLSSGTACDLNGNLTTYGSSSLTYDTNNRMVSLVISATYAYDGVGQRVSKVAGGVTTVYVYDAFGNPTAEYSSAAATLPVCATCYLSWDQLGSTRLVTDQNATPVARHDFLPFGGEVAGAYANRPALWGTTDCVNPSSMRSQVLAMISASALRDGFDIAWERIRANSADSSGRLQPDRGRRRGVVPSLGRDSGH